MICRQLTSQSHYINLAKVYKLINGIDHPESVRLEILIAQDGYLKMSDQEEESIVRQISYPRNSFEISEDLKTAFIKVRRYYVPVYTYITTEARGE